MEQRYTFPRQSYVEEMVGKERRETCSIACVYALYYTCSYFLGKKMDFVCRCEGREGLLSSKNSLSKEKRKKMKYCQISTLPFIYSYSLLSTFYLTISITTRLYIILITRPPCPSHHNLLLGSSHTWTSSYRRLGNQPLHFLQLRRSHHPLRPDSR
jgi:hypothetical protein